ncbi:hypothetical protein JRQ81_000120 [Phrynocephalus forsythii]|uniref:Ig-like domain-containing protein n=1 Tax=Phrynocephalus forsythii TaxID=171643 RepID=A0A9Q0Y4Q7_9SAUR|nr:hypothetical protein JRQ81_000120 [Phrynocephalus forsythii]
MSSAQVFRLVEERPAENSLLVLQGVEVMSPICFRMMAAQQSLTGDSGDRGNYEGPNQIKDGKGNLPSETTLGVFKGSIDSQADVVVTQQPLFDDPRQGGTLELKCSVNQENYYFFWYHQVPGQTELKPLGIFRTFEAELQEPAAELKGRLSGKREGKNCSLNLKELQPSDSGLYLCAARDTVVRVGAGTGRKQETTPSYAPACIQMGSASRKTHHPHLEQSAGQREVAVAVLDRLTLGQLWTEPGVRQHLRPPSVWGIADRGWDETGAPLEGQTPPEEILQRLPVRRQRRDYQAYFAERGTQVLVKDPECNHDQPSPPSALLLGPACHKKSTTLVCLAQGFSYKWPLEVSWKRDGQEVPRLSVATEKAKKQDKCSFGIASRLSVTAEEWKQGYNYSCHVSQGHITADAEITSKKSQQTDLGFSGIGYSLRIGQLIFLLLTVKSFAYGTVLWIYTVCRKTSFRRQLSASLTFGHAHRGLLQVDIRINGKGQTSRMTPSFAAAVAEMKRSITGRPGEDTEGLIESRLPG